MVPTCYSWWLQAAHYKILDLQLELRQEAQTKLNLILVVLSNKLAQCLVAGNLSSLLMSVVLTFWKLKRQ